ncbi:MAG: trifunctional dihydropteroate synthetase [Sclerophora amabilis]|nr:MAG: trifunctional dihydropteroate synthetase [Sclerophora amabilis]
MRRYYGDLKSSSSDCIQIKDFLVKAPFVGNAKFLSISVSAKTNAVLAGSSDNLQHSLDYRHIVDHLRSIPIDGDLFADPSRIGGNVSFNLSTLFPEIPEFRVEIESRQGDATSTFESRPANDLSYKIVQTTKNGSIATTSASRRNDSPPNRRIATELIFSLEKLQLILGVLPEERENLQPVRLTVTLLDEPLESLASPLKNADGSLFNVHHSESTSRLPNIEYMVRVFNAHLSDLLEKSSFFTVEALASHVADNLLRFIHNSLNINYKGPVSVRVEKLSAFPDCKSAGITVTRRGAGLHPKTKEDVQLFNHSGSHCAFVGLGSNMGDRVAAIETACREMNSRGIKVVKTSSLWETEAMYVVDQDPFLNGVCEIETRLTPMKLLDELQSIEQAMGRRKLVEKGPRNIDLDILLYDHEKVDDPRLNIPHKLMIEREFVLRPLCQLLPHNTHPSFPNMSPIPELLKLLPKGESPMSTVTPISATQSPIKSLLPARRSLLMAILNVTPDSFSDGGVHSHVAMDSLASTLSDFVATGATIIDVGGQSTRPGAGDVGEAEELDRVIPAIRAIRSLPQTKRICISIDTFRAHVAQEAIKAGADMVNDISGGSMDEQMLPTVAKLGATICLMHMRGTPATMNGLAHYPEGVVPTVGTELLARVSAAQAAGIPRWRIILDPGIGFAKTQDHNLEILRNLHEMRAIDGLEGIPWLVGTSRKSFIGRLTGVQSPQDRIWGTAGAVTAAVAGGADILRVHDVKEMSQVVKMADAIWRH